MMFRDRKEAGELLGQRLKELVPKFFGAAYSGRIVVLGLPRGGVPVAKEVSQILGAPLDIIVVRKLGVPGQEELAMGAVASGDAQFLNEDVIGNMHIDRSTVERMLLRKKIEVTQREKVFMAGRKHQDIEGKFVVLVDDGLATGASMKAAVHSIRSKNPAKVLVAVPVAPSDTLMELRGVADFVICLTQPEFFYGVGGAYHVFSQTSDEEVLSILNS